MSHSNEPPGLPVIVDEAGDTPDWVPLVGLALAVVVALLIAARQAFGFGVHEEPAKQVAADAGTAEEGKGAGDDKRADDKPADDKPANTLSPADRAAVRRLFD